MKKEYLKKLQLGKLLGVNSSRFEDSVGIVLGKYFPGLDRLSTTNDSKRNSDLKMTLSQNITKNCC